MPGHWEYDPEDGNRYWVEDPEPVESTGPSVAYNEWGQVETPPFWEQIGANYGGNVPSESELEWIYGMPPSGGQSSGGGGGGWSDVGAGSGWQGQGGYEDDDEMRRGQRINDSYGRYGYPTGPTPTPGRQNTQQDQGNRGGGGGGGAPPDPNAWMAKFGGPAIFKAMMRAAGENMQKYYARLAGDPVKTVINKFQELQGYSPDTMMRQLAIGALGLGGVIDPDSLDPIFNMPDSNYLNRLQAGGKSLAGLTRSKFGGIRQMGGNDWWSMNKALKPWAPEGAADFTPPV